VSLDTNACIYFLGAVEPYREIMRAVLNRAQAGKLEARIGGIVLLELLVAPFKSGRKQEVDRVRVFTAGGAGVTREQITESVLYAAAELRAITGLSTPDALVVASAAVNECDAIIGNDGGLSRIRPLAGRRLQSVEHARVPRYLHLDDFAPGQGA
jgi:predicted nucleic acid-binding protein